MATTYNVAATDKEKRLQQPAAAPQQAQNQQTGQPAPQQTALPSLGQTRQTFTQSTQSPNSVPNVNTSIPQYNAANDAAYMNAIAALQQVQSETPTYTPSYDAQIQDMYNQIVNRDKFQYDVDSDLLYREYAQQYQRMGQQAMEDTMGQAAALTGGYGSTYSQAAGQQQYDKYMQDLTGIIPELYAQAYQQYQDEGDRLDKNYQMLWQLSDDEYDKYMDTYNQWLNARDYAQQVADTAYDRGFGAWGAAANQYNADRNYDLSREQFEYEKAWQREQFEYKKQQDALALAMAQQGGSGGGGGSRSSGGSKTADTSKMDKALSTWKPVSNSYTENLQSQAQALRGAGFSDAEIAYYFNKRGGGLS